MEILKEVEELSEKAQMYENMRTRYLEAVDKLEKAQELISEAGTILDPVKHIARSGERRRHTKYTDQIEEQYNKMKTGQYISTVTLERDYPDLDKSRIMRLYTLLSKAASVLVRRDGNRRELYLQKEG